MALAFQHGRAFSVKMGIVQHFLLGCLLLQLWNPQVIDSCGIFENPLGDVTDDDEILVGTPLEFWCTLFNKTVEDHAVTSRDIIMTFGQETLHGTRIVDKYTSEYTIQNTNMNHTGMYNCFVPLPDYLTPQLVCSSYISVGTPPADVRNFTCISFDYTKLVCTWEAPFNTIPTTYVLEDFLYDNKRLRRKCPIPFKNGCESGTNTKPAYIQSVEHLDFIVTGNNSLGTSIQYFRIKHSDIIKPGVPSVVTENVKSTSLVLRLSAPRGLENGEFPGGLIYSIKYYSISTKLNITKVSDIKAESNAVLLIEDLVPHTLYKFEIRCRLNTASENFHWSNTYIKTEITEPDVPYRAPVIDMSAFDIQVIAGNRTITVYWKGVPEEYENAENFEYDIAYHEHYVPTRVARQTSRKSNFSVRVGNVTSYSFEHMDTGSAYMFKVIAANRVGNSSNETAIVVVDKTEKLLQGPKDITVISYGQGNYDVSWKAPDVDLTNFTLYWCETLKSRPAKCDGPLDWTPIINKTYHKLFLPNNFTNYQFAVATVQKHKTSGMYWAPCTVLYGVPYKIRKIELFPKTSTSLKVRWSLKCEAEKKIIKEYAIHYCPFEGSCNYENARTCKVNGSGVLEWPSESITNMSQTEHILGSLKPYTCYFSYLRVRTDGGWGENSDYAYEITMTSAPSDPPANVHAIAIAQESKAASIKVSFDRPSIPNGVISRYKIYYNKTSSEGATYHKEVRIQDVHNMAILDNVFYYSNYSIEITACVDQACSEKSEPIYVYTGISRPSVINLPRLELMDDFLNITWEAPPFPNGPAEFYQVKMENNDSNINELFNVTHQKFFTVSRDCSSEDIINTVYDFKVRAVNFRDGIPLFGDYSGPAKMVLCPKGYMSAFKVGLIVGSVFGILCVLLALYYFARISYKNIVEAKKTTIKLPKGLESPLDNNPLSSYDKFKSGLQNSRDSGIPNDRAYDRLFSSASEGDLKIADELAKRGPSGRNPSGESSASGKGHDSISSANTTKTHNSMDSGAEVESPPSPDSFSSDSVSMNTTPRAFKPDLGRVNEVNHFGSKDSGLAKDDTRPINFHTNFALSSKGRYFEENTCNGQLHHYSKFAIKGSSFIQNFAKYSPLYPNLPLSNSEPSVADFDVGDGSEPLVNPSMQPYSKFGLAISAGNGLNTLPAKPGYSKYGAIYRRQKIQPQHPQVFSALTVYDRPGIDILSPGKKKDPTSPTTVADVKKPGKEQLGSAYSKFGVVEPNTQAKAYISLKDALMKPAPKSNPSHRADARKENVTDTSQEDLVDRSGVRAEGVVNKAADVGPDHEEHPASQGETSGNKPSPTGDEDCKTVLEKSANAENRDYHVLPQVSTVNYGCSPLPLTCPTVQKPNVASNPDDIEQNIDISTIFPPNFAIGSLENNDQNDDLCNSGTDNSECFTDGSMLGVIANGPELSVPRDTEFSTKFLAGGQVFYGNKPKVNTTETSKLWYELGEVNTNTDAHCNKSDNEPPPERPTSNGFALFSQLTNDTNISVHVVSRPNLANVPVESV